MEALIALFVFAGICAGVVWIITHYIRRSSEAAAPEFRFGRPPLDDAPDLRPFARRNYFFSAAERGLYEILCTLSPAHTVFAKVRLADLVRVQASGREFWQRFNSISGKHVDFVLCDEQLAPIVAIELDEASPEKPERLTRDQFVDSVLESASLPIVHVRATSSYVLDEIRLLLAPHLRMKSTNVTDSSASTYRPPQGWRPSV